MKILIADDEMISRAAIQRMIRNYCPWAGPVKEASNGRDAVEMAKELDADVALLDIEMPELDGMEAARQIRQWKEECVIVFLTAFATFQYAKQAISMGATEFLVKPVDPAELQMVLDRVRSCVDAAEENCGFTSEGSEYTLESSKYTSNIGKNTSERSKNAVGNGGQVTGGTADIADEGIRNFGSRAVKITQDGKKYMDLHYMDDIGVDTMARMYQVSANYFNKMFKQAYHISSKEYLINIRVEHAMEYLRDPAMTIREAGILVGYEDSNYFTRIFKKKTGMTPIEYRNKCFLQPGGVQEN